MGLGPFGGTSSQSHAQPPSQLGIFSRMSSQSCAQPQPHSSIFCKDDLFTKTPHFNPEEPSKDLIISQLKIEVQGKDFIIGTLHAELKEKMEQIKAMKNKLCRFHEFRYC